MTFISTSVIIAFFVGMLFRDLALILLVRLARQHRAREAITLDGKKLYPLTTKEEMDALARKIVESTMAVELDTQDGMLYLYNKSDGQFLAQATDMHQLTERLRQRYGTGRIYIMDDDEIIKT